MEKVIWNGELINRNDAKVDIEDRGYQFGDGVYEMVRVYNGHMFTVREHLVRLVASAEKIRLTVPYSIEQMENMLKKLVTENNVKLGTVYIQMSRGVSARNHIFPGKDIAPVFVANTKEMARPEENMKKGVKAISVEDIRWLKCDIKSLNLLGNLLAKQSAADAGCFEAIQHRSGIVTEGSSSNVSIVVDGKIKTHQANNLILNGIVRQVMIQTCLQNNIPIEEAAFTLDELMNADEVFVSSTTAELMPIIQVDGKKIGNGTPGNVTKRLQALYEKEIEKQCGVLYAH